MLSKGVGEAIAKVQVSLMASLSKPAERFAGNHRLMLIEGHNLYIETKQKRDRRSMPSCFNARLRTIRSLQEWRPR